MPSNGKKLANQQRRRYKALFQNENRHGANNSHGLSAEEYFARPLDPVLEARRLKFNTEQRERNRIAQEQYQASQITTAQKHQTPAPPHTFTKGRIVRTKYHVKSDKLIDNLPAPTELTPKPAGNIIDQITIDFYVCRLYHKTLRPSYLIDL